MFNSFILFDKKLIYLIKLSELSIIFLKLNSIAIFSPESLNIIKIRNNSSFLSSTSKLIFSNSIITSSIVLKYLKISDETISSAILALNK